VRGAPPALHDAIRAHGLFLDDGSSGLQAGRERERAEEAPAAAGCAGARAGAGGSTGAGTGRRCRRPVPPPADDRRHPGARRPAHLCARHRPDHHGGGQQRRRIIADGSIHVYAPLHGRALAGASGNADARIFALSMQPELVSIAGVYRTFDEGFPAEAGAPAGTNPFGRRPNRYIIAGFGNSSLSRPSTQTRY
jgi:septum site-determining protein MinC